MCEMLNPTKPYAGDCSTKENAMIKGSLMFKYPLVVQD